MEHNSTETVPSDSRDQTIVVDGTELTRKKFTDMLEHHFENVCKEYVKQNPKSTNTQLFSSLALLNAYIPESYLLMSECLQILGPPDPIHGGPPFKERMEPFAVFIKTSSPNLEHVRVHPVFAQTAVKLLADLGISRSATVKKFMFSLCGDQSQPHTVQLIKHLLIKREMGKKGKEKFSQLIDDIQKHETFFNAVFVLKTASQKFRHDPVYPQNVSRLYYIKKDIIHCKKAEEWAKKAIKRDQNNSYVADTLGQVYKKRLMWEAKQPMEILSRAKEALEAFQDVERKADREEGPDMWDRAGTLKISNMFNNRGLFGFIQVAKIVFEKLNDVRDDPSQNYRGFIQNLKMKVEKEFDFFEWYLTYSKPDMMTLEPFYFWKNVVLCYEYYTTKKAAESTSFPGLLDVLNRGLFMSKGRHAELKETEITVSELEAIQDDLKTTYEANVADVKAAERYILSNIILSNKVHNSPQLTPVKELQTIIHRFLGTEKECRSPEFYLLVLLLIWPEEPPQVVQEEDDEEMEQQTTEDDGSKDQTSEDEAMDEEQETRGEPAQPSPELMLDPDLQQHVTFMGKEFQRSKYTKYLRGRYLLPLFFLGRGSGLSKWIHKSRLDAIVERMVDAELADEQDRNTKEKRINEMWISGEVWAVPEIQDILLPVRAELCHSPTLPQDHEEQAVFVYSGGKKIVAEVEPDASELSTMLFYLGFTIQGPVLFKVGFPQVQTKTHD